LNKGIGYTEECANQSTHCDVDFPTVIEMFKKFKSLRDEDRGATHLMLTHLRMHKNFEKTLCPICPMRFRSKISLSNHLSRVHGKEDAMNQPTESKDKIENFSDLHGNEVHFMVQKNLESQVNDRVSDSTATTVQKKNGIISLVTENQSQHLSVCIKYIENEQSVPLNNETKLIIPSSNSLRRKHEKEEHPWNLECKVCSLYFQTQANLDFHMRTHEKKQDRINTHLRMHKNFEKTLCPICPMRFRSKISLSNHLSRVHGKEDAMNQPTESKDKIENFSDLHGNEVHF
ncbi:hypothetical protein T12_12924, partial [Trichinella patagoniensis]